MKKLKLSDVTKYVEENISDFHQRRIASLNELKLDKVLKKKNPYLFKAKHYFEANDIIESLVSAFVSSNEETIFGNWLEGLAIFINQRVYGGWKSGIPGIDLEFDHENTRYIVTIKSGPNWGNSGQIAKMKADFVSAKKTLRTSNSKLHITAVNGCCYGRDENFDKGDYFKYCGQRFWTFISGEENLYSDIVEPLGHKAKERNEEFLQSYGSMKNKFTLEFAQQYCLEDGSIDWMKLVKFNSGN